MFILVNVISGISKLNILAGIKFLLILLIHVCIWLVIVEASTRYWSSMTVHHIDSTLLLLFIINVLLLIVVVNLLNHLSLFMWCLWHIGVMSLCAHMWSVMTVVIIYILLTNKLTPIKLPIWIILGI